MREIEWQKQSQRATTVHLSAPQPQVLSSIRVMKLCCRDWRESKLWGKNLGLDSFVVSASRGNGITSHCDSRFTISAVRKLGVCSVVPQKYTAGAGTNLT
jgi:hypothetical protein